MSKAKSQIRNRKKYYIPLVIALLALLFGHPVLSRAEYSFLGNPLEKMIEQIAADGTIGTKELAGVKFAAPAAMKSFYEQRHNKAFWTGSNRDRGRAEDVLDVLADSWTHGLNPDRYHVRDIAALMEDSGRRDAAELLLTDAVIRYARDITGMRVNPAAIRQKAAYWRQPLAAEDILQKMTAQRDVAGMLQDLAPQDRFYKKLREELITLSRERNGYEQYLPIDLASNYFKPGERHRNVKALRARLGVEHDSSYGPENFYDDRLAHEVMTFQGAHGLTPDGIIGPKTLELLNRSNRDKIEQIIANMERLRWLDQDKPDRYILVNIPSQMLWAIEDGRTVHEMRVVAGMPVRQTKDFKAEITGIRFNPTWTVPLNLKMADMLPKLKEDPYILANKGIEMYRGVGKDRETVDPESVDWESMSRSEMNKIRMVQSSGDHNALGRIRVLMPNDYDIYLHDTNHKEFFVKDERLLSSGCVRLSEPDKIAMFVLSRNKGWSREKMEDLIAAGKMVEVPAEEKLPVYILYQTIWQDEQGQLVYGADVYKRDRLLLNELKNASAYQIPGTGDASEKTATLASAR